LQQARKNLKTAERKNTCLVVWFASACHACRSMPLLPHLTMGLPFTGPLPDTSHIIDALLSQRIDITAFQKKLQVV
jgi:hypothetical protein